MQIAVENFKGGSGKTTITLSIADILKKRGNQVDIIEHDVQLTIDHAHALGGRHKPKEWKNSEAKYIIHDLPPYNSSSLKSILNHVDIIIIPIKVSYQDLFSTNDLIDYLTQKNLTEKAWIVLNEVRKPYNNMYREIKQSLETNYQDINIAKTELSNLIGFRGILKKEIYGQAQKEIMSLMNEIGI